MGDATHKRMQMVPIMRYLRVGFCALRVLPMLIIAIVGTEGEKKREA